MASALIANLKPSHSSHLAGVAFLVFVQILFPKIVFANEASEPLPLLKTCEAEIKKLCPNEKEPRAIGKCLANRSKELSVTCRQEIERFLQASEDASEVGGGALSSFGGLNAMGPPIPMISYDGRYSSGENGSPAIVEHQGNLSIPVYKNDSDAFTVSLAGGQLHMNEKLSLSSGIAVPETLTRTELGLQYFHQLPEKRNWDVRVSAGYSGDKPFQSSKDLSLSLSGSYGFPGSGNGFWMLSLFMTNNSPFLNYIPIPGVVYFYETPTFTGMFGFPMLSMQWTPVNAWVYSISVFGPTVQAEIAYGHRDRLQFFTGYSLIQQSYIPSNRVENRDLLILEEQKAAAGIRLGHLKSLPIEIQFGRAFGRSIYMGNGFMNKDRGLVSLADAWIFNLGGKYAF